MLCLFLIYSFKGKGNFMSFDEPSGRVFLQELYNRAEGDFEAQISMYDIGTDLGLEKNEASAEAQDLFIEGLAEMKTLSGGMGITQKGLDALGMDVTPKKEAQSYSLGSGPVLDDQGKKSVYELLDKIKADLDNKALSFDLMEEIVIDLKTIEVQMLSPNPKTAIIRETFKFLNQHLKDPDLQAIIS
jgi:hypothetical protein